MIHRWLPLVSLVFLALATGASAAPRPPVVSKPVPYDSVVPAVASAVPAPGVTYEIAAATTIYGADAGVRDLLARQLRRATGFTLPVAPTPAAGIALLLSGSFGDEGYQLDVTAGGITIRASAAAGLFNGVQTLRQLLPPSIEASGRQPGPWPVQGGRITDHPRFAYRGAMLDVARHFFPVAVVERYIDEISSYKINHLHLHLSDDQGWRIAVESWPRLATFGGRSAVDGDPGGYYTKADYQAVVAYAVARNVTVVPEIDMPGHVTAALAAYPELTCDGRSPPLYTGTEVGFSSLCTRASTETFVRDVLTELAALTPGPYLHIGGDETESTKPADYAAFMDRAQRIVADLGKTPMAWHEVVNAPLQPGAVAQYWGTTREHPALAASTAKVILSPAGRAYLDMKYDSGTGLGATWAGTIEADAAYDWNPGRYLDGVDESRVLGVEAPLWTETITTIGDIEHMAFPRLPAIAELGWSPWSTHDWPAFSRRLAAQGPRWHTLGLDYHQSPQVPWPPGS
ncbi:beta-N-acetylhexosaminidase [Streptosporangiaceae bacterium NEAU-GS5]|nr:beta-N-acetylhexosaminidase [Streptosporangiaceae bacterium NEAU-GS5]